MAFSVSSTLSKFTRLPSGPLFFSKFYKVHIQVSSDASVNIKFFRFLLKLQEVSSLMLFSLGMLAFVAHPSVKLPLDISTV